MRVTLVFLFAFVAASFDHAASENDTTGGRLLRGGEIPFRMEQKSRDLSIQANRRWKDRVGDVVTIPYNVDSRYFTSSNKRLIEASIQALAEGTKVIKFVQRTTQSAYINVVDKIGGCASVVGKSPYGKVQEINLARFGCLSVGTIQHEFLHALGFWHEQNRPDRDDYVTINYENIPPKNWHNFYRATSSVVLGDEYEYSSVMHYGRNDFAIDRSEDTITPLDPTVTSLGQRGGATDKDMLEVRLLYQCLSGPRTLEEYNANLCTSDCKCWEGATGCNGDDDACQGTMTCSDNQCVSSGGGTSSGGTNGGGCTDISGWTDSEGRDCAAYEENDASQNVCARFGSSFASAVSGKTASEACCVCGGGSLAGTTFYEFRNKESPNLCLDLGTASTENGTPIVHYPCNGTPAQKWWVDSNYYIRSALDTNKCIVGSDGGVSKGTYLIINDCFANDDRFVFFYYTDDTFRPKNNNDLCVGPSRTRAVELESIVAPLIQFWDCYDSSHQQWTPNRQTRRRLTEESLCSDTPNGWYDSQGDNCLWYAEGTNCDDYGSTNKNFGMTANQACCACGGGSLLASAPVEVAREDPVAADNGCWDSPIDWRDSVGDSCLWYSQGNNCAYYGDEFASEWGTANEACCACGGGMREAPPPVNSFEAPGCSNAPSRWLDHDGDGCDWYAEDDNCELYGGNYTGEANMTANEACCACGGGTTPNATAAIDGIAAGGSSNQWIDWLLAGRQNAP